LERFGKLIEILLVEDNPGDARLTFEAFGEIGSSGRLTVVEDGVEALAYLRRRGRYADAPRPHLILLDLNLPRKSGHEVLAEVKDEEGLKQIPIIVLTTSHDERDITKAYDLRADCYITKPIGFRQFVEVARSIDQFWGGVAQLPTMSI